MTDWIVKLDDFLKLAERDVLKHAGNVSHDDAARKAREVRLGKQRVDERFLALTTASHPLRSLAAADKHFDPARSRRAERIGIVVSARLAPTTRDVSTRVCYPRPYAASMNKGTRT